MNDMININLKELEDKIKNSYINDYEKKILFEMLQAILLSKKGRIYTQNHRNYKEYIALRDQPGDMEQNLSFCIVKRTINEFDGSTASRAYEFYSFPELIKYYQKNRAAIDLEMAIANKEKNTTKQEPGETIAQLIERVNKLTNIPNEQRLRAVNVLTALNINAKRKFFITKDDEYEEFVTIRNNTLSIARRMIDYSGSTAGITYTPIDIKSFINYLENNKAKLGEDNSNINFKI